MESYIIKLFQIDEFVGYISFSDRKIKTTFKLADALSFETEEKAQISAEKIIADRVGYNLTYTIKKF